MSSLFFDINVLNNAISALFTAMPYSLGLLVLMVVAVLVMNACLLMLFGVIGAAFLKRMNVASGELEQQKREVYHRAEALLETARKESFVTVGEANKKAEAIIEAAQKESSHIMDESIKKASDLIKQTQEVKEMSGAELTRTLQAFSQQETQRVAHVSEELIQTYRAMIESSKQQNSAAIGAVAKEMADHAQQSLKQFQEFLKDQTTRYEGALKQQVQEGFMSAQKEIGDYKRESLRKAEDAIYRILNLVTKSVLGKALSLEDQQDLVIHALGEAKQQGFFEL